MGGGVVFISEPGNESHFLRTLSDLIIGWGYPTGTPYCCHAHLFSARTCSRTHTRTHIPTHTQVLSLSLSFSSFFFSFSLPAIRTHWRETNGIGLAVSFLESELFYLFVLAFHSAPSPHPSLQSHSPSLISSTLSQ